MSTHILGLACFFLVAACASQTPTTPPNFDANLRTEVELVRLPHVIDPVRLADQSARNASILLFLEETRAAYGDRFWIDAGSNVSVDVQSDIADFLYAQGFEVSGAATLGAIPSEESLVLYLERYSAVVPDCGFWPEEKAQSINNVSAYFGCSNTANLGLMIADPRDLVSGRRDKGDTQIRTDSLRRSRAAGQRPGGQANTQPRTSSADSNQ